MPILKHIDFEIPAWGELSAGPQLHRWDLAEEILALPGLVAYWKCDDLPGSSTLADASGHGNALTLTGGYALSQAGQVGSAVSFNGSNGYAWRAGGVLGATVPAEWTLGLLARGSAQDNRFLLSMGNSGNTVPVVALCSGNSTAGDSPAALRGLVRSVLMEWGVASNEAYGTAFDNSWRFLVIRRKAGVFDAFINGVNVGSKTVVQGTIAVDRTALGCYLRAASLGYYAGLIQHAFACTDGLSDAQVLDLAQKAGLV